MIQILISLIILISYILSVCMRWGVPNSISQSWFSINHKWIFSMVMTVSFGLLFNPMMIVLPEIWQWLGFITVAGGILIGFAPNLNDELEEKVHMTGAVIMGIGSQGIVILLNPIILLLWILWLLFVQRKERVFIAEMIGGICLYISLLIVN